MSDEMWGVEEMHVKNEQRRDGGGGRHWVIS